jgi:HEPN domain-containing protein
MNSDIAISWLNKAEDDLGWTKSNIKEKVWYGACFTAHQSVEKSLKSFLLANNEAVAKIHDLNALVERCKKN